MRAIGTIGLFSLVGPLLGAGFMLAIWDSPSAPRTAEGLTLAFVAAPVVGLFPYPIGILPAMMTGCLAALISPVTGNFRYLTWSTAIGAVTTGLLLVSFGVQAERIVTISAAGAFAALCCAALSSLFRYRPARSPTSSNMK